MSPIRKWKTGLSEPAEKFVLQTDQAPEFWQFLNGLRGDDLLVELIVNELDARSTRTELRFEADRLVCEGNGDPVDDAGWARLAFIKGAGLAVKAKSGLFGVKNHGLKACFTIGNDIVLRSAGRHVLQTLFGNGPGAAPYPSVRVPPRDDPGAPASGTRIEVPYRSRKFRVPHGETIEFEATSGEKIEEIFRDAVASLPKRLIGLVRPGILGRYTRRARARSSSAASSRRRPAISRAASPCSTEADMRERVRLPQLDLPKPWRVAGMVLLGIVLTALAAWMAGKDDRSVDLPAAPVVTSTTDPLVAEMRHCQALGESGGRDPACLAAWAENRRRFLGVDLRPEAPLDPQATPSAER